MSADEGIKQVAPDATVNMISDDELNDSKEFTSLNDHIEEIQTKIHGFRISLAQAMTKLAQRQQQRAEATNINLHSLMETLVSNNC